jgi:Flp pilus assembly protein TadG
MHRQIDTVKESQMTRRHRGTKQRKGAAVVEFAVCLPILVILVMGAIECTSMIFLKQALNVVAYEGIRVAIRNDGTTAAATARANEVITERNLNGASVSFQPNVVDGLDRGTPVRIRVTAPCSSNALFNLNFFRGNLEGSAFMIKE